MVSRRPSDHLRPINRLHTERTALEPYWFQGYERGGSLRIAAFAAWAKNSQAGSPDGLTACGCPKPIRSGQATIRYS
jgi:hypothetical protein